MTFKGNEAIVALVLIAWTGLAFGGWLSVLYEDCDNKGGVLVTGLFKFHCVAVLK